MLRALFLVAIVLTAALPAAAQTSVWTWRNGPNIAAQYGTYGTKGAADSANVPGARDGAVTWRDSAGHLWLFGGVGYGTSSFGDLNDLWKWDGTSWTWMSGSEEAEEFGTYGTKGSPDPLNVPGAREGAVSWIDAAGNLWLFGGYGNSSIDKLYLNDLWKWDGVNWTWMSGSDVSFQVGTYGIQGVADPANVPGARYFANAGTDSAGNFWLFGGLGLSSADSGNLNDLWKWDGANWTWVSGSNLAEQVGTYGTKGVSDPMNVPGARYFATFWSDPAGHLWLFGGYGNSATTPAGYLNDLWKWDGTTWTWISGSNASEQAATYGTKGVAAAANVPSARSGAVPFRDAQGKLWLFGGEGLSAGGPGYLNDLWRWDGAFWTWMSGTSNPDQAGIYGTLGVPDPANAPGARAIGATWNSGTGTSVTLFGGYGFDSAAVIDDLDDLWTFEVPSCSPPSATITTAAAICAASSGNSASVPDAGAGATYAWTVTGGTIDAGSGTQAITFSPSAASTSVTLSVVVTNAGGCATESSTVVTVNPAPVAPTAGNGGAVCAGGTITLTASTVPGATYAWTGPNGYTSSVQNPTIPNAATAMSGTYSVRALAGGCASPAATTVVTVNATPPAPTAGNGGAVCTGGTIALTASTVPGATYAWMGPAGFTSALQNPTIPNATAANAGTYSVTATTNGCPSPAGTTVVTVNSTPGTPTASSNSPVCSGSTILLSTPAVSGATYSWAGPNGFTSNLQNPTIPNATAANAGTYSVTVGGSGCVSGAGTTAVVVNATPASPTAGNGGPYTAGQTISLTASTVPGATYSWTGPNGFTSSAQNPTRPSATAADAGVYSVTATVGTCTSPAATTTVVVNGLTWSLTITKLGAGAGQITSSPAGISCGSTCTFTFPDATPIVLTATADAGSHFTGWSGGGCSGTGTCAVTIHAATTVSATFVPDGALSFYTVVPCRVLDTRDPAGPFGGPALDAGAARAFQVGGTCGVPADAVAVSLNATVTGATSNGLLTLYPGTGMSPITSTVNFAAGRTRANNAIMGLIGGYLTVQDSQTTGTVNFILDVNGYFR